MRAVDNVIMSAPSRSAFSRPAEEDITVTKIFEAMRDRIVNGVIAPGSLINSVELAQHFGTSRTPVREALLILSQYGLVTLTARRRPQVMPVSVKAIRDLYSLRTALHEYLSEAIVAQASDTALQRLRAEAVRLLHEFEATDTERHLKAVEEYLDLEARLSENGLVLEVLDSLRWRIAWFRRLGALTREQLQLLAQERIRVADAYLLRDHRLAQAINRSMLRQAGAACEASFNRSN
jgi:DNA-binding GntR family transcriptional regulator